jgi:hypothetical protein
MSQPGVRSTIDRRLTTLNPLTCGSLLGRSAMTYVREQLRARLAREISRQYLRWLHPTSHRRPGERFL